MCYLIAMTAALFATHAVAQDINLRDYHGRSIAALMRDTGWTPDDYFDDSNHRTFIFNIRRGTLTLPPAYGVPAVSRTFSCAVQVDARPDRVNGQNGTASSWTIIATRTRGACG